MGRFVHMVCLCVCVFVYVSIYMNVFVLCVCVSPHICTYQECLKIWGLYIYTLTKMSNLLFHFSVNYL